METGGQNLKWTMIAVPIMYYTYNWYKDLGTYKHKKDYFDLDMKSDSAAYIYTQSEESDCLAIEYLAKERKINKALDDAWWKALKLRAKDMRLSRVPLPRGLREEHVVAIIAYTLLGKDSRSKFSLQAPLYLQFNEALQWYGANDTIYAEKFHFKSFHYLLSVAIHRLREVFGKPPKTLYRRMNITSIGKKGDRMKFGYFASSSPNNSHKQFGNKTIFTISSNYGAFIENYSNCTQQAEVLIPPYEAFIIERYEMRTDGVDVSLKSDGMDGIRVRVERGSNREMRVLRYEGTSMAPLVWLFILTSLALILLRYR